MKMEYLRTIFAYLYSGGRSFWFFAIKYTLNHFNLVSGAIGIINTVSATYSDCKLLPVTILEKLRNRCLDLYSGGPVKKWVFYR